MSFTLFAASIFTLQAAAAQPATETEVKGPEAAADIEVTEKKKQKKKKIKDKNHPDYVRCKSEPVIGSRAKRNRTCMTNREWALVSRRGNEESRKFLEENQAGFLSQSN